MNVVIRPGMVYEDCAFHPVLCTEVDDDGSISGISLIDGSAPRTCDPAACGVVRLSIEDVIVIRRSFATYLRRRRAELGLDPPTFPLADSPVVTDRELRVHPDDEAR